MIYNRLQTLAFTENAHCIGVLSLAGIQNTTNKCNLGKKGFGWLSLPNRSLSLEEVRTGNQHMTLEARTKADSME